MFQSVLKTLGIKPPITLRTGFIKYLEEITPTKKNSSVAERSLVKTWMDTSLADMKLSKIKAKNLVLQRDLWLKTLSPATVTRRLAIFSHMYNIAHTEWGYEKLINPVKSIRKPKVRNSRDRRLLTDINIPGLSPNEFDWLENSSRSKEFKHILTLAVETAMRRSELTGILWENVDFVKKTVYLVDTKNGYDRTVPLTPVALKTLSALYVQGATGLVFKTTSGSLTRLFVRAVRRTRAKYTKICSQLKITPRPQFFTNLHFHDLRHEGISRLAPHFQAHELARISGHRDTRMLMRYYHPDIGEFAERLDKIFKVDEVLVEPTLRNETPDPIRHKRGRRSQIVEEDLWEIK